MRLSQSRQAQVLELMKNYYNLQQCRVVVVPPPLNLTVICRNLVSSWSWQCWFGVSGVQDSLCVLQSHVLFLKRRCQLVGLGCRCDISRLEESEG